MPKLTSTVSWREAILETVALWAFVLLIFLPLIIERHVAHGFDSILIDSSTVLLSMALGLALFALFRATLEWPSTMRAVVLGGAVALTAMFQTGFDFAFTGWVANNLDLSWRDMPLNIQRSYGSLFRYLCIFTINMGLFQLTFSRRWNSLRERQLTDAESTAQQAQLAALRYQLNPHFLFNALNSISALIVTRRNEDAEHMTEKLSGFLRASLAYEPGDLIPLDEELALLDDYLDIESIRFGSKLVVEMDCDPDAGEVRVPVFLIQPLVENAVKHGVAHSKQPVKIAIEADIDGGTLCVTVRNDRVPFEEQEAPRRPGVGLANVRQRLKAVYGEAASLATEMEERHFCARLCIPVPPTAR
jgi:hypothetical protein